MKSGRIFQGTAWLEKGCRCRRCCCCCCCCCCGGGGEEEEEEEAYETTLLFVYFPPFLVNFTTFYEPTTLIMEARMEEYWGLKRMGCEKKRS
jgi:hypothetical protein